MKYAMIFSAIFLFTMCASAKAQHLNGQSSKAAAIHSVLREINAPSTPGGRLAVQAAQEMLRAPLLRVRADSLVNGLTTLAVASPSNDTRMAAIFALAGSNYTHGEGTALFKAFNANSDKQIRGVIAGLLPAITDIEQQKNILYAALATPRDPEDAYSVVASLAVSSMFEAGPHGTAMLRRALDQGMIKDHTVRTMLGAELRRRSVKK